MAKKKKDPSLEESMLELRGETASPAVLSDENLAKIENLPAETKTLLEQRTGATSIPQAADGTMGLNLVAPAPAFRMGTPAPRPLPEPAVAPTGVAAIPRQPSVESSDLRTRMGGEPLLAPTGVAAIPRQPSVESSDLRTRMGGEPLRTPTGVAAIPRQPSVESSDLRTRMGGEPLLAPTFRTTPPAPRPVPAPAVVPTLPPPTSIERADAFLSSPQGLVSRPAQLMVPGADVVKPRTPEQTSARSKSVQDTRGNSLKPDDLQDQALMLQNQISRLAVNSPANKVAENASVGLAVPKRAAGMSDTDYKRSLSTYIGSLNATIGEIQKENVRLRETQGILPASMGGTPALEPAPVPAFRTTTPMVPRALPEPVAEVARPNSEEQPKAGMEKKRAADSVPPRDLYVARYGEEDQYTGLRAAPAADSDALPGGRDVVGAPALASAAAAPAAPTPQKVLVRTPYGTILATPEQAERLQTPYVERTPDNRYLDRIQTLRENRAARMADDRKNFADGKEGDKAFAAKWNSPQYRSIIDQTSVVAPEYAGKRNPDELPDWFKQRQAEFTPMMGGTGGSDAVEREVQRRERAETAARRAFKQKTGSMVGAPPKNTRKDVTEQVVGEKAGTARVVKAMQEARFTLQEFEQREKALQAAIDKAVTPQEQAKLREELRQLQESFTQQEEAQ